MPKLQPVMYDDFSGGINKSTPADSIADNELDEALNMNLNVDKSISSRKGIQQYNSTLTGASRVTGIHYAKQTVTGASMLVVTTLAKIYKDDGVGGWTDITGATVPPSNTLWKFRNFNNLVIGVNGTSVPQKNNFAGNFADLTGTPPDKCSDIEIYQGRVILSGDDDEPSAIHGSAASNPEDWTTAGDAFKIFVDKENGYGVIGTAKFFDDLIIFKRKGVYRLVNPTNLPANMQIVQIFDDVGCVSNLTIRQIGNELVWLDDDGVYALRATQESGDVAYSAVSKKIQVYITDTNKAQLANAVATDVRELNQYRLSVPKSGATNNNHVIVRDYFHGAWLRHEGVGYASFGRAEFSSVLTGMAGDYAGKVYKLDTTEADAGAAFNKEFKSKRHHYGAPQIRKFYHRVYTEYEVTGTYPVAFTAELDFGLFSKTLSLSETVEAALWDVALWDVAKWDTVAKLQRDISIGRKGRNMQVRFFNGSASQPYTLYKYALDSSALSRRGGL